MLSDLVLSGSIVATLLLMAIVVAMLDEEETK